MSLNFANLGQRLREARERRRLSQRQIAEQFDVPETTVILIESGRGAVSILELVRWAELCRCRVSDFFDDESPDDAEETNLTNLEREPDSPLTREEEERELVCVLALLDYLDDLDKDSSSDQELRSRMICVAIEAYRREKISRGRLLELSKRLRVPGQTLLRWAEAAKESDSDLSSEEIEKHGSDASEVMSRRSLIERRAFLKLPPEERKRILAEQAERMASYYERDSEWREWLAGDIVEY